MAASSSIAARLPDSVLIANRGEIACRIIRTCRRLGVHTIAIYSDADRDAMHVALADDARCIGPAPPRDSYLNIASVVAAAKESGASAVHPGYGFLSENADFARACAQAGIVFIGPPADAIAAMGSKSAAKARMEAAGVPVLPGYHGQVADDETLTKAAVEIGFPVLIKPSAGGGGRGMRRVDSMSVMADALRAARREALAAFGDDHLLIEKFLTRPRHVEVQVFADSHGNAIHLYERDCSVQRRHQKVFEEAPAPGVLPDLRAAMGAAAVAAAKAIGYVGAGTVEFLLDEDGGYYFMEMNTRLQVEHPVTEMVTGLDLVEWQLRVAAGEALPLEQDAVPLDGHAIEARLYAEDPHNDFVPSAGFLTHLRLPAEEPGRLRVDTGVCEGDEVSAFYDPLMAKIIAHGADRDEALGRLRAALAEVQVVGPETNAAFLAAVANDADFAAARLHTGFVDEHKTSLIPAENTAPPAALACAAAAILADRADRSARDAKTSADPYSPWRGASGWRLNDAPRLEVLLGNSAQTSVLACPDGNGYVLSVGESRFALTVHGKEVTGTMNSAPITATVVRDGNEITIFLGGAFHRLALHDPVAESGETEAAPGRLTAPMPGVVVDVAVSAGQAVKKGDTLIVLEAMKVEHTIRAPADGTVDAVHFSSGDRVEEGVDLLAFSAADHA